MSFAWPHLLWLLVFPAGLLAWELLRRKRRTAQSLHPKILRAEISTGALNLVREPTVTGSARVRPWLLAGLAFTIVALARPQWGRIEEPVFDQAREILLAVDLSRSMLAPDVKPSRLERSKLLIQALLEKLQGERVGLVVFSGTAFLQSPLSADYEILREFLPALNPDFLPEGGTNYRALLDTALDAFSGSGSADRFLIVLSDGEATDDDWKSRIDELKKRGVRVIGLGVGTPNGSMIPDGSGGFVKDSRGAVVLSKLESATLQQLATDTNGAYRDASTWLDLAGLVNETVNTGRKGEFTETNSVRLVERFQWPLALALWCLLVSLYYELPVRPRPREIRLGPAPDPARPTAPRAATVASVALALLALVFVRGRADAAVQLSPPPPGAAKATEPKNETPPLAKIVGRLATAERRSGRDWADMANETVAWGNRLKSGQQTVPPGPVRDALAAVDLGSAIDPKAADWPKLREDLKALLENPEPPKQDKQQQNQSQQKDQSQQNQPQDQPKNDPQSKPSDSKQNQPDQKSPDQPEQKPGEPPEQKNEAKDDPSKPESAPQQQSAFGDMNQPPPPPPSETQKVGGAPEKKDADKPVDPALALPMEKLDQLKNQDSPAKLFQMMQAEENHGKQKKPTKDW